MNTQKIKNIINQYFDNELSKSEEVILFTQLSMNEEAREYFKQMNLLKTTTESLIEEYPNELDVKIFEKMKEEKTDKLFSYGSSKIFTVIGYSLAIVLLAFSLFFYNQSIKFKDKLELTNERIYHQNQMIQVLYNTLPQAEVKEKLNNEIIVTAKM